MTAQKLSRAAFDRLQAEFDDLTTRGRIDVANKIEGHTICALGDSLKPTCANNTERILNNIDDVIEFVVNDISGTKTGLDVQNPG